MRTWLGLLLVTAMLAVTACATGGGAPAAPPSVDVTGEWVGTWAYQNVGNGSGDIRGRFQQEGANVTGSFNVTGPVVNNVANIIGTVSGNTIKLMMPSSGYLTVNGNQITGYVNGMNVANLTMRKQ
ncbi:MAG TPA: hypothetical protein VL086_22260 [Candidatus Nitrosotalea sp.]|nr:hypothetical protein [Candidatus Nitrosotalea sp.]